MGKPFPYFTTEFVIHSTLVVWSPRLLLFHCFSSSIAWISSSIIAGVLIGRPLDLQNEGVELMIALRVHPPAIYMHYYYILLHIITYCYCLTCPEYSDLQV